MIHWGEPVAVLHAKDPNVRISYPDFIWDDGLHITETQKTAGRVHAVPNALLRSLWEESLWPACGGLLLHNGLLWVNYYSSHEGKTDKALASL